MTVAELAAYLRGVAEAGLGDSPVWARTPDANGCMYPVQSAKIEVKTTGEPRELGNLGILWLTLEEP